MSSKISIPSIVSIISLLLTLVGMNILSSNRTTDSFTLINKNIASLNEDIAVIGTTQLSQGKVILDNKDETKENRDNLTEYKQEHGKEFNALGKIVVAIRHGG